MRIKNHQKQEVENVRKYITYCIDGHIALGKLNPNDTGKSSGILDLRGMVSRTRASTHSSRSLIYCSHTLLKGWGLCGCMMLPIFSWACSRQGVLTFLVLKQLRSKSICSLFKLVSPFIDPVTRKKVVFVLYIRIASIIMLFLLLKVVFVYPGQESERQMLSLIPKSIVPADMGGTGELIRIDEAWDLIQKQDLSLWLHSGQKLP